ncbi:hypothetical protein PPL_04798 [Heterostelium album PN500]|uniref:Uncharacterized protein n=1 Tax=Heterostelium pallidum (strain ATCC 26659 / Pp 5 / PN500) TaxID=670386 RepID=D3B8K5_HETP5|nr:hypothetical protein PPL_04798 [Heterostelium album PN500]EFA82373.1 hypothetical protein PPL_04798 [Heterostelium album PN500]|eukprot:XP_020434490.1 hypothetical protein PPL_04798 [Heterostelium album PN500]
MDPLSMLAAEEEAKILQAQKAREAAEVAAAKTSKTKIRNHFEEEESRLESITRIHLHDPTIDINSNIKEIEIKDRNTISKKKWVNSFCVVNFDLEIGQTLDYSYPKVMLRDEEITNLCFLSFPDSNSHLQGDIIYSFKLNNRSGRSALLSVWKHTARGCPSKHGCLARVETRSDLRAADSRLDLHVPRAVHYECTAHHRPDSQAESGGHQVARQEPGVTTTAQPNSSDDTNNIPASIIGVTNPFFLKALSHWPTIINIGTVHRLGMNHQQQQQKKKTLSLMSRDSGSKQMTDKEKITTEYKPYTSPDKNLVKKITDSGELPSHNETLRKYFLQLTLSFLIPLERYFSSLLPLAKTISVFQRPPRLKNFDNQEFLDKLAETDETYILDSKSKEIELYKEFLESVNFKNWLEEKRKEAIRHLNTLYRKAILDADVHALLKNKTPSTALDLHKRVKDQLILEENLFQAPDDIKQKLRAHLDLINLYFNNIS